MQASSRYTVMVATVTVFALAASMLGARKITEMSAAMQDAAGDGAAVIELSGCAFRPKILAVRPGEVVSFANTDSGSPNVLEFRTEGTGPGVHSPVLRQGQDGVFLSMRKDVASSIAGRRADGSSVLAVKSSSPGTNPCCPAMERAPRSAAGPRLTGSPKDNQRPR